MTYPFNQFDELRESRKCSCPVAGGFKPVKLKSLKNWGVKLRSSRIMKEVYIDAPKKTGCGYISYDTKTTVAEQGQVAFKFHFSNFGSEQAGLTSVCVCLDSPPCDATMLHWQCISHRAKAVTSPSAFAFTPGMCQSLGQHSPQTQI
jgi:hypothetical protein